MIAAARSVFVIIAALFLSAGHIACACASLSAPMSPSPASSFVETASADAHAHHHAGAESGDENAPADADCSHCKTALLAADGIAKSVTAPALQKIFAIVETIAPAPTRDFSVSIRAQRLHWAGPPRSTPVSLKIRLRN